MAGVSTSYVGMSGDYHEIADDVLIEVLAALGIDASDDAAVEDSLRHLLDVRYGRLVPPTVLHVVGREDSVLVHTGVLDIPSGSITLENGEPYEGELSAGPGDGSQAYQVGGRFVSTASLTLPADIPAGYHTLNVTVGDRTEHAALISAPAAVDLPAAVEQGHPWGWMAQLYSIRSRGSWGVGDYHDLREMLTASHESTGADFVLVNPLHAAEPVSPLTPSPYLPASRRFVNFTYIRPEDIEEYRTLDEATRARVDALRDDVEPLNGDGQLIDRDAMWRSKMRALWTIFKAGRTAERQAAFDEYKRRAGTGLEGYATWCLCYDKWGAPSADPTNWVRTTTRDSSEVATLREVFPDTLEFYRWLEWIASSQLGDAQRAAKESGMALGVMADVAVGVHPLGSEVWWNPERFARGATVGAPPDMFNQQGQDWSQPPLNPLELADTGYQAYREMVHDAFAYSGAVRIDHILGLFRLWWIPSGRSPIDGAYVRYDADVMLGILALEAQRAGGLVIGEDLGVVPPHVADTLARHGILGCAVEWFEQRDGAFRAPGDYRPMALASVNTHDLPPAAGYLEFEHVKLRERLGLLEESGEEFERSARHERDAMMRMLVDRGYLDAEEAADPVAHEQDVILAQYRALRDTPCKLRAAALVDAVGEKRAQNQPGTSDEYPNWRIPLADRTGDVVPLDGLFDREDVQRLAAVMRG